MTDEKKKEYTLRISQAGDAALTIILYEITNDYLEDALKYLEEGNREQFIESIHRAQNCIKTQQNSIQFQYEPGTVMFSLYIYLHGQLAKALAESDPAPIREVMETEQKLCDAYKQVEATMEEQPLMENAQKVYVGLTYGKNSMPENMEAGSDNRGFRA